MKHLLITLLLSASISFVVPAHASDLVLAWQAPDCSTNSTDCQNFLKYVLPNISGIGVVVPWKDIDDCSSTAPCSSESAFDWAAIDNSLNAYVNATVGISVASPKTFANGCVHGAACKIILIIQPENDSGGNNHYTPTYVFTTNWATHLSGTLGYTVNPQDISACSAWQGNGASDLPFTVGGAGWNSTSFVIWNYNDCFSPSGSDLSCKCTSGSCANTNFSGFPVVYEQPIVQGYQNFLNYVAIHYSSAGSGYGSEIAPYIAYVRAGMSQGGEDYPNCTMAGRIPQEVWHASGTVPGGYVIEPAHAVNAGDYLFMATGPGTSAASLGSGFWCQTPGCYTSTDGSVPSWKNVGAGASGNSAYIVWPGPKGQFGTGSESQEYSDNGYLSTWNSPTVGTGDGIGYIARMTSFLASLNASFPWTISSHTGPPGNVNNGYADSEAVLADENDIGFGMQSVSIEDPITYSAGNYPTTREDWADNFNKFASTTPVRHLQVEAPGSPVQGAGYTINTITVAGTTATVNCNSTSVGTCSDFSDTVEITGDSNSALNGTWTVLCGTSCSTNTVTFTVPSGTSGGTGGTVWEPGYLPIVAPFADAHNSTSLEVWECILDYTYGTTTISGCATGITGPDSNYESAISGVVP
jgi:hypothetical protein